MYAVVLARKAEKQLARLPQEHQVRVNKALIYLRHDPWAGKKMRGQYRGAYSLRAWPYRIIYRIEKRRITVYVLAIGHRQGVYL